MPTTLLLIATASLLLLALALISGRVLALNLLPRVYRDLQPSAYWTQVAGLGLVSLVALVMALHASPVLLHR